MGGQPRFLPVSKPNTNAQATIQEAFVDLPSSLIFRPQLAGLEAPKRLTAPPPNNTQGSPAIQSTEKTSELLLERWKASVVSHGWITDEGRVIEESVKLPDGDLSNGYRVLPPVGGREVEISIDGLVSVPAAGNPSLRGWWA